MTAVGGSPILAKLKSVAQLSAEKKDAIIRDYSIKSERIHSVNQLLKAFTLFIMLWYILLILLSLWVLLSNISANLFIQ